MAKSDSKQVTIDDAIQIAVKNIRTGQLQQADTILRQILSKQPNQPDALHLLGLIAYRLNKHEVAIKLIKKALAINANDPVYYKNLGTVFASVSRLSEAVEAFERALSLSPDDAETWNNLGLALSAQGENERSEEKYRKALALSSNYSEARSNWLFLLSYNVLRSPQAMLEAHKKWDDEHGVARNISVSEEPRGEDLDSERPLRIGYVSPDFCHHAVSYFFEPIIESHARDQVEIFCYAEISRSDEVTERIKALSHGWRVTSGLSHEQVATQIQADGIDILVDLAGHTAHNRLRVFTYKPAPVQATYLGYCTTTGLETMDYWISDEVLHPKDTVELATETYYRLPRCWLCYRPHENAPAVMSVDLDRTLTFGSLNERSKLTPDVLALWCEILLAVPESRLLLKTRALSDQAVQTQIKERFAAQGIGADRLTLLPRSEYYLSTYHEIDIALDTFPRTGGATTADALWMGVPVLTLSGERMIERQGVSMLTAVGLEEFIATTKQEYVEKAVALAKDAERRKQLRGSLREQMAASPLCDARGLAQALEEAYRDMWQKYIDRVGVSHEKV